MAAEETAERVMEGLAAQAALLWGQDDVARQRPDLQRTAEEIATMAQYTLAPDLEPRFF